MTCAIESLTVVISLYFINTNNLQYKAVRPYVDEIAIKQAWLDAKENLCKMLQIDDRASYTSYETWWRRRHDLRNYLLIWQNKSILRWPESEEFNLVKQEFESAADQGSYLRSRLEDWVDPEECDLNSWADCQKFLYETDLDVRKAYMAELETIIQFQLIILQNAKQLKESERKYLFKFIREKRAELFLVGINFEISNSQTEAIRYAAAQAEIKKLSPDKQTLFNALKVKFIEEERQKALMEEMREQEEERKSQERQNALAQMSAERQAAMQRMLDNPNMPIEEMPDCDQKLTKIREWCRDNNEKYTDA